MERSEGERQRLASELAAAQTRLSQLAAIQAALPSGPARLPSLTVLAEALAE